MTQTADDASTGTIPPAGPREATAGAVEVSSGAPARPRRGPWLQWRCSGGFEWNPFELPVADLPPGLEGWRIVHLSDLHHRGYWTAGHDELIERVTQDPPDLILITGDFVDSRHDHRPALPMVRRMMQGLSSRLGIFAILGNHDSDLPPACLEEMGLTLLDGRRVCVPCGGGEIELIGLPGLDRKHLTDSLLQSHPQKSPGVPRIVLSHFPDLLPRALRLRLRPDLFLCGHTHGGQVCLPGGFPLLRHDSLPRRLCKGIHRIENTWMVANRGFGFACLPLRLFCPAEVIDLRLTRRTVEQGAAD